MSKGIIITDIPENCYYCDFCHTKDYDNIYRIDGEKFCGIENMNVDNYCDIDFDGFVSRPDWCPIKPLRQPIEVLKDTNITLAVYKDEI